jgi:hypothetical protein
LKKGWTVPFVTGHKYKISWGNNGLDWDQMKVELSERWAETDKSIYFVHNFTDVRESMDVTVNSLPMDSPNFLNDTIGMVTNDYQLGNNVIFSDPEVREFHFIVNGKQPEKEKITDSRTMKVVAHRCKLGPDDPPEKCGGGGEPPVTCPEEIRKWSDPKSWSLEELAENREEVPLPQDGDNIVIQPSWNMEIDLDETPLLDKITINGCLHFKQGTDVHLRAKKIVVRGELFIGTEDKPYTNNGKITLEGDRNEPGIAIED